MIYDKVGTDIIDVVAREDRAKNPNAFKADLALISKRVKEIKEKEEIEECNSKRDIEHLQKAKEIVKTLEDELGINEVAWNKPYSWELTEATGLQSGDGVLLKNAVYIVIKRMAWWRSNTANILCSQESDPTKYLRIGTIDFVQAYRGYVTAKKLAKQNIDPDKLI